MHSIVTSSSNEINLVFGTEITPVLLTFNEAPNLKRTLGMLYWAERVVVVDSFSTDQTQEICQSFKNVDFFQREFDSHSEQWNYAIRETDITSPWILALDADYILTDGLIEALGPALLQEGVSGWRCHFKYLVFGRPLHGSLYPPVVALFRTDAGTYEQDGHTQRLKISGNVKDLPGFIHHDDRKPLSRWLTSQTKYAGLEADFLLSADRATLGLADRLRLRVWPAPLLSGIYVLFAKGCILNGRAGWYYTLQRVLAEILLALELIDRRLRGLGK